MSGLGEGVLDTATEIYREQQERNPNYDQKYEYRTILALGHEQFDSALNEQAKVGWELVGFQISSAPGTTLVFYGSLRRQFGS